MINRIGLLVLKCSLSFWGWLLHLWHERTKEQASPSIWVIEGSLQFWFEYFHLWREQKASLNLYYLSNTFPYTVEVQTKALKFGLEIVMCHMIFTHLWEKENKRNRRVWYCISRVHIDWFKIKNKLCNNVKRNYLFYFNSLSRGFLSPHCPSLLSVLLSSQLTFINGKWGNWRIESDLRADFSFYTFPTNFNSIIQNSQKPFLII